MMRTAFGGRKVVYPGETLNVKWALVPRCGASSWHQGLPLA